MDGLRYRIIIRGRVQGVWYRRSAAEKARELGVSGYVRNQPDGSVLAEVEGTEAALHSFIAWCRVGPPGAQVDSLEHTAHPLVGYRGFEVRP